MIVGINDLGMKKRGNGPIMRQEIPMKIIPV